MRFAERSLDRCRCWPQWRHGFQLGRPDLGTDAGAAPLPHTPLAVEYSGGKSPLARDDDNTLVTQAVLFAGNKAVLGILGAGVVVGAAAVKAAPRVKSGLVSVKSKLSRRAEETADVEAPPTPCTRRAARSCRNCGTSAWPASRDCPRSPTPPPWAPPACASTAPSPSPRVGHKAPRPHTDHHPPSVDRHVGHRPRVLSVHPPRRRPAHRADHGALRGPCLHHDPLALVDHILYDQRGQTPQHRLHKLLDIPNTNVNDPHLSPSPPNVRRGRWLDRPHQR